jgi:hypothetical protein
VVILTKMSLKYDAYALEMWEKGVSAEGCFEDACRPNVRARRPQTSRRTGGEGASRADDPLDRSDHGSCRAARPCKSDTWS